MAGNILDELDGLIDQVSQKKLAAAKIAGPVSSKLDSADDGTTSAQTGAQAADQQRAQNQQYPDNMTDTGAKDNQVGGSVENSTDQATAVQTSGQEGTEGSQLGSGGEVSDDPESAPDIPNNDGFDPGAFKQAAATCLKIAEELEKAAEGLIRPMDRFLVSAMRQHPDPQIRKEAMAMADDELAAGAADSLMQDIAQGNVSDEEAASILQEAVEAGVISEEEVAEAAQAAQAAMSEADPGVGGPAEEELMEAKLAAANIGPDDPRYIQKLAGLYSDDIHAGYVYGMQLAQRLAKQAEDDEEDEGDEDGEDDGEGDGEGGGVQPLAGAETPAEEAAEGHVDPMAAAMAGGGEETPGEEAAEDMAAGAELGMAPEAEALAPEGQAEEADLAAVAQELGLTPEQAQQLLAAPMAEASAPAEGGPEMLGKMASALKQAGVPYRARVRAVLLNKVAALGQ